MTQTSIPNESREQRRLPGAVVLGLFLLGWLLVGIANRAEAAGCQHSGKTVVANADDLLEAALMGKWQYVGGQTFYVYHPAPVHCDGPGCRQAPEPGSELGVIPIPIDRNPSNARPTSAELLTMSNERNAWEIEDQFCLSPTLSGMLRPPC